MSFDPAVVNPALIRLARLALAKTAARTSSSFVGPDGLGQAAQPDPMVAQGVDPMAAQSVDPMAAQAQGMDPMAAQAAMDPMAQGGPAGLVTAEGLPEAVPGLDPAAGGSESGDEAALFEVVKALNQASAKVMGYLSTKRKGAQERANAAAGLPPASAVPAAAAPQPKAANFDFGDAFNDGDDAPGGRSPGDRLGDVAAALLTWRKGLP